MDISIIASLFIFAVTFLIILTERMHRTVIALFGAVVMLGVGMFLGFYHPSEALESVDFNTIALLFGMMVLVAILETTGLFQYLGILAAKKTKGNPWALVVVFGTLTTVLSLILDNVTTIILIVPVTIVVSRILKLNPVPFLMAEALLSDVGGVATLVGDPPNIMIGSAAAFSFNDFLIHSLPVVVIAWLGTLFTLKIIYNKQLKEKPQNIEELMKMEERDAITDYRVLKQALFVLGLVVVFFFLHGALHLPPSMVAVFGASLALVLVSANKDPQKILEKIELSVLLFFAALFVIVGGLEHAGVLEVLAKYMTAGVEENLLMTALIVMWSAAVLSAIVDNIPLTVAMIPIIGYLETQGVAVDILWWALVFGVGFGGNGSPIGSTANIIVVSKSEQTDTPITFKSWMKSGVSTMVVCLVIASIALAIFTPHYS